MRSELKLRRDDTLLVVIDVQERLATAMEPELFQRLLANLARLGKAAELLHLPVVMSEQYPQGLGPTLEQVRAAFPGVAAHPKVTFDASGDEKIAGVLKADHRPNVIVTGIETHVCVYQTVRSLAADHQVHVLFDAVASRTRENYDVGLKLAESAGAIISSTETVLFDLLERAGTDEFRAISKLVR